jgi:hypothetical protein|nr:MAG TPA: hypothetical protein [Bacteriophage sp.]
MKKEEIQAIKASMVQYTGTKTIMATPMTRGEYNALRGWEVPADEDANDQGYLVQYENDSKANVEGFDGYISWSPQKPFDLAYNKSGTLKQRVFIEMEQLYRRMFLLKKYIHGESPDSEHYRLLIVQLKAMDTYYQILCMRYEMLESK